MVNNKKWSIYSMIEGSKLGKTNVLTNLINEQCNIDKIYLYAKDLKYEF